MGFTIQIISAVFPATLITAEFGKITTMPNINPAIKKAGPWLTLPILFQVYEVRTASAGASPQPLSGC
jgi:hypothetical protein